MNYLIEFDRYIDIMLIVYIEYIDIMLIVYIEYCHVVSHWDDRNKINTIPRVRINSSKPSKNGR